MIGACRLNAINSTFNVAPLNAWEAPDNLSKGSVVVHGVVIGGEHMKRKEGGRQGPTAAPAKAKQAAGRRLLA